MATSSSNATFDRWESEQRVLASVAVGMEKLLRDLIFCFDAERVAHKSMRRPQESQRVSDPKQLEQLKRERKFIRSVEHSTFDGAECANEVSRRFTMFVEQTPLETATRRQLMRSLRQNNQMSRSYGLLSRWMSQQVEYKKILSGEFNKQTANRFIRVS